jgi:hypothetical protein
MLDKTRCKTFSYSRCFITTLDDDQMRTAVWWTKPKIGFLMEPHRGFPHIKASVYDCPSNGGRVVYEYMRFKFLFRKSFSCNMVPCSTTMANDARLGGSVVPEVCGLCHDVAYRSPFHEHSPCRAFYVMSFLIVRSSIGSGLEMWKPWLSTSLIACACWPMFLQRPSSHFLSVSSLRFPISIQQRPIRPIFSRQDPIIPLNFASARAFSCFCVLASVDAWRSGTSLIRATRP